MSRSIEGLCTASVSTVAAETTRTASNSKKVKIKIRFMVYGFSEGKNTKKTYLCHMLTEFIRYLSAERRYSPAHRPQLQTRRRAVPGMAGFRRGALRPAQHHRRPGARMDHPPHGGRQDRRGVDEPRNRLDPHPLPVAAPHGGHRKDICRTIPRSRPRAACRLSSPRAA